MVVGVTGGLSSGKSLVTEELRRLGALTIDADEIARKIVRPGSEVLAQIRDAFGDEVIDFDGALDRARLASIIFRDKDMLECLNNITLPKIRAEIDARIKKLKENCPGAIIVVNAPLLMEVGHDKEMDKVIVVTASIETQIKRATLGIGISAEEARARIDAQMPIEEKIKAADFVIDNNGEIEDTLKRTREVFEELSKEA